MLHSTKPASPAFLTWSLIIAIATLTSVYGSDNTVPLNLPLQKYVKARAAEFDLIPAERKKQLAQLAAYVVTCSKSNHPAQLTFICTHNSRRSHLAQIWAQVAAIHFGLPGVQTFSGGTAATAFNPRAIAALRRAGFEIPEPTATSNPHYQVRFHSASPPLDCFSKVYSESPNPQRDFCAVLVCSQADEACPLVPGAALRLSIPYDDPKAFDGTHAETEKYDERSQQIAREMLYAFATAKQQLE